MTSTFHDDSETPKCSLTAHEAAFVDALLEQGGAERASGESSIGADCPPRLAEIIHALSQLRPAEPPENLTRRTIIAAEAVKPPQSAMHIRTTVLTNTRQFGKFWDPRKTDIAVMLIAATLLLTVTIFQLGKARTFAIQTACANNLAVLGTAFGQYAQANANQLPQIAIPADHDWLPQSMTPGVRRAASAHCNLANLEPLLNAGRHYISWNRMVCPAMAVTLLRADGRPAWKNLGYSYIDELSAYHHHWGQGGRVAVLADRNPLFSGAGTHNVNANSWNHTRRGQNVLYDDGSVIWTQSPDVGPDHDNIWSIGSPPIRAYTGVEEPQSPHDIILVP